VVCKFNDYGVETLYQVGQREILLWSLTKAVGTAVLNEPMVQRLSAVILCMQFLKTEEVYMVLLKNSGNLNRAPEPVVVCPSAARCG
jgi:hypothetical protein